MGGNLVLGRSGPVVSILATRNTPRPRRFYQGDTMEWDDSGVPGVRLDHIL